MDSLFLTQEERIYNAAKRVSSVSDAGKTGQLLLKKNEIRTVPNTIHKDKTQNGLKT